MELNSDAIKPEHAHEIDFTSDKRRRRCRLHRRDNSAVFYVYVTTKFYIISTATLTKFKISLVIMIIMIIMRRFSF